jgi:hypothetical protein
LSHTQALREERVCHLGEDHPFGHLHRYHAYHLHENHPRELELLRVPLGLLTVLVLCLFRSSYKY